MSNRKIEVKEENGVSVVSFVEKKILDEGNIQITGNQLFSLIDDDHRDKLLLDFSNVEYLSSAALGKLIMLDKKVKAAKGALRLAGNMLAKALSCSVLSLFNQVPCTRWWYSDKIVRFH